jgi:hypothetical protein
LSGAFFINAMKRIRPLALYLSSLLIVILSCCENNPWPEDLQVHFMLNVQGLKDTLRANRDTLVFQAEVPQPTVYLNTTRGFKGKHESVQLPEGFLLYPRRMSVSNPNSYSSEGNVDSLFVRIPVFGKFAAKESAKFDVTIDKSVFYAKYVPTQPGLYVVQVHNNWVRAKNISMETYPGLNLTQEKRNFHLLSEQMKRNGRRVSIVFYVK